VASRRDFLIGAAGAGIGFGLGALSHRFPLPPPQFGPDWQPGEETFVASTCLLCPAHCGIRGRRVDGLLTRIDGNPLHPVSQGGLCPKGSAGIQLLYHPDRLRAPMRRVGPRGAGELAPVAWEEALDLVVKSLATARERGEAGRVEWLVGDAGGLMGDLVSGFCAAYGTDRVFVDDYRDGSAEVMRLCQGIAAPPAYDLAASDFVLSFGAALSEAWWALPQAAQARHDEGGRPPRWVQADVRLSRTAASADEWVPVRPGTYGTLALGIAYFLLKEGQYDADMTSERVSGWEDWTDEDGTRQLGYRRLVLRHGRPDFVSARTGVPLARLVSLAKSFGQARRPVALWDQAVAWRTGGLADALAIHALNVLAGALNRPGGLLVQGALPPAGPFVAAAGGAARALASASLASTRWRDDPPDGPPAPVLFLYKANPLASTGAADRWRAALSRSPLVVSFSPFLDETTRHADLILPDHTYLERWDDAPAPAAVAFPVWGVVQPVTRPLHDTRATGDVILHLAAQLGGEVKAWSRWSSLEQAVRERGVALAGANRGSAFVPPFRQRELRELEGRGWWLPHGRSAEAYWQEIRESGGWFDPFYDYQDRSAASQHPDGRVWIFPPEGRRRLRDAGLDLAEGFLPTRDVEAAPEPAAEADYPLQLVPYRVLTLASGGTALMPWLLENLGVLTGDSWGTWVEIHPRTAQEMNLRSGQRVRVQSAAGAFEATLRIFRGAQPGVLNAPYGLHASAGDWGRHQGANPLAAVGDRSDPVTGLPDWYSTRVRVVPV
jgi:anaerobic selenocysteine-containing dehydrogenase